MKLNKSLIIVLVIVMNILAAVITMPVILSTEDEYQICLEEARQYAEQGLCKKSLIKYDEVIDLEDTLNVSIERLRTYEKGMINGEFASMYSFSEEIYNMLDIYHEEPKAYEIAAEMFYSFHVYTDCIAVIKQAQEKGIVTETIERIKEDVLYLYDEIMLTYETVISAENGTFLSFDGRYRILNNNLSSLCRAAYDYATPMLNGYSLVKYKEQTFLISEDETRQAYFPNTITDSTGVGDGLIACKNFDKYSYYNLAGSKQFGEYLYAGRFSNGIAAVQTETGWKVVDLQGNSISSATFEDIKLSETGRCELSGVILAKSNGKYGIYDMQMNRVSDVALDDVDLFMDDKEYAACRIGEKWGFIDILGNVVIQPQYDGAKSFSNGLGAVKKGEYWSFITSDNDVVIDGNYIDVGYFNCDGYCFVKSDLYWEAIQRLYVE